MNRLYLTMLAVAASTMTRTDLELDIVNTSAPPADFVFSTEMSSPLLDGGLLQSRIFQGEAGSWVYEYRLDLRGAPRIANGPYATSVEISTGPVAADRVFVVTAGGFGSIGLQSASGLFGYNTFEFTTPVSAGDSSCFWGYTSQYPPQVVTATVATNGGNVMVNAYAPKY